MLESIYGCVPSFVVAICSFALVFLFFCRVCPPCFYSAGRKKITIHNMLQTVQEVISRQQGIGITLLRELVAFAAMNPEHGGQDEAKKARWIAQWLHQRGMLNKLCNKSNECMSVSAQLHQAKVLSRMLFDAPEQIPTEIARSL